MGVNLITGSNPKRIIQAIKYIKEKHHEIKNRFKANPFGDGEASKRIIEITKEKLKV